MSVQIDFDQPTYLRIGHGLAVVSKRLDHMLPECSPEPSEFKKPERVSINRTFNPNRLQQSKHVSQPPLQLIEADPSVDSEEIPFPEDCADVDMSDQDHSHHNDEATELSFQGQKGRSFEGVYVGSGHAPYRFHKGNSRSFFVRISKHLIWGVELKSALNSSGAVKGDRIEVTFMGKQSVEVLKQIQQDNRTVDVWETRHRNQWDVRVLSD